MVKKLLGLMAAITVCSMCMVSCSKDEPENQLTTGVHKIVVELSGSGNNQYVIDFAGGSSTGTVRLYDGDGKFQGTNYMLEGVLEGSKKFTCYTDDNATFLIAAMSFSCDEGESIAYTLKGYVNDQLTDELSDTFNAKDGSTTKSVTLSTGTKK